MTVDTPLTLQLDRDNLRFRNVNQTVEALTMF